MKEHTPNAIGVDISKARLDAHRLRDGEAARFGNDAAGFEKLARWIGSADCVVYEATGRYHRDFEEALAEAGLPLARANPLRARRFAQSMGNAKTDAVDAAVLARMGAALNRQQNQRVALLRQQCRRRLAQIDRQLKAVDARIAQTLAADDRLARRAETLASIPGVGQPTAAGLLAAMPELGGLDAKAAASLAGLAPVARESGQWQGKRFIQGGRARVRRLLYMAAVSATRCNPDLGRKYQALVERGKPPKVALVAVMRKLLLLANALLRQDRLWTPRVGDEAASEQPAEAIEDASGPSGSGCGRQGALRQSPKGRLVPFAPSAGCQSAPAPGLPLPSPA